MASEQVFVLELQDTHINYRLSYPSAKLDILPPVVDKRDPVEFQVRCGEKLYTFRCIKRSKGPLKPVIVRGWSDVVRDYGLRTGDILEFYRMKVQSPETACYWIELRRCVSRHEDPMGTTLNWQRIA